MNNENNEYLFDLINILSFIIGVQNLSLNDKQIEKLENHLKKQDKQYEEIIKLLNERRYLYGKRNTGKQNTNVM